jgi:hypothetical protein
MALGLLIASPARAELTSNELDQTTRLYYLEDASVVGASCPAGTHIFDHATCKTEPHRVPRALVEAAVANEFGGTLAAEDREAQDLWVRMKRAELRIDEVVISQPTPANTPSRAEIDQSFITVAKAEDAATAAADQVARLTSRLAAHPSDTTAAQQLTISQKALTDASTKLSAARDAHTALYARYLAAQQASDASEFQDLVAQHEAILADLKASKARIAAALADAAQGQKLLGRLGETFVWESSAAHPLAGAARFAKAFDVGDKGYRTFTVVNDNRWGQVKIDMPRAGVVDNITCYFPENNSIECDGFYVTPPGKEQVFIDKTKLNPDWSFTLDAKKEHLFVSGAWASDDLDQMWGTVRAGTWDIEDACALENRVEVPIEAPGFSQCSVILKP